MSNTDYEARITALEKRMDEVEKLIFHDADDLPDEVLEEMAAEVDIPVDEVQEPVF